MSRARVLLGLALLACHRPAQDRSKHETARAPVPASASASASARAASPASTPVPAAAPADAADETKKKAACDRYPQAMAQGRAATAAGRYDDAIAAFDRAVRARPVDARARAERGFAYLKRGSAERALRDFHDGRVLTRERGLLAQLYFNIATASAALNAAEAERLALVLAWRQGSRPARERLGERSTCPATWQADVGAAGPIARSFLEMVRERPVVGCDYHLEDVRTEAQARKYVCRGCAMGGEDLGDQCDGPGPWNIASGYMSFTMFQFFVAPLPGKLYFYSQDPETPHRVQAGHLLLTGSFRDDLPLRAADSGGFIYGRFAAPGASDVQIDAQQRWSDQDDDSAICDLEAPGVELGDFRGTPTMPAAVPLETIAYSLATKHRRFALAVYDGSVLLSIDAGRVRLRGEGCDTEIPLPEDP